ncbi:PKD domain-containing protein [Flavobacterium sp.]|uniref:PKD domain-containing protein n=1 Tax=Flavobacterium sp. TaxID=239 RepID=UPI003A953D74
MNGNTLLYKDSFEWDFGDGTTSTELNPIHSYSANGSYTIQLKSYKCFLGQAIESIFERTVNFCAHTNTVFPSLMLSPNETGTFWTQKVNSYQWYDFQGNPIEEATNQPVSRVILS